MILGTKGLFCMNKSDIKNSADMFLYKAIIDFNSGKYLLEAFEKGDIEIDLEKIYFELQQCSEKLLKSLLTRKNVVFPKTHDIEYLIELCKDNDIPLPNDVDCLIELNDFAVDGRYSIIHDDIDDSYNYINILEKWIEKIGSN